MPKQDSAAMSVATSVRTSADDVASIKLQYEMVQGLEGTKIQIPWGANNFMAVHILFALSML